MNFSHLSPSDKQNAIYFIILLIPMILGIFSNRNMTIGKMMKYCGVWLGFCLVFIIGYSYRYELIGVKNRVTAELNPSKVMVNQQGQLVLQAANDGHFYLDAMVNKKPLRFMVDTGASSISLSIADATLLGIDIEKLSFNIRYETANGTIFGAPVTLAEFEAAGLKFQDVKAAVNGGKLDVSLLGMSFLRKFKRFEFSEDKLILTL